ncbi:MAG: CocE/NonD family hydrolase [Synechococcaceae bacterium WB9_4xB_025]|nr:CocE/NonD family hydrolase [Synechococcaceae bacterium WB9_4xB_025]
MCADQPLFRRRSDCSLLTPDGIRLQASLWRPLGEGPWPALLMRQPYGRAIASTVTLAHPQWWSEQGFLVMVQDVRGQGESEGHFGGFGQEAADTATTLRWLRSHPNCNGRIGLYGFSYQGFTQLVADEGTEPPDCLAPAMTGLDEREHWSCEGGAHWWHLGLGWGLQLAALQAARRGDRQGWKTIRQSLESGRYLGEGLSLLEEHDPHGMALRWFQSDPEERHVWPRHTAPRDWLAQPMLIIGGWWDPHLRGCLNLMERSLAAGGQPELHIGPATHLQWWPAVQELHRRFFQRHLQEQTGVCNASAPKEPRLQLWDQRLERWSGCQNPAPQGGHWQLEGSGLSCHDPQAGRLLPPTGKRNDANRSDVEPANGDASMVVLVHDPWRPAPAVGGHLSPTPGPCERGSQDARSDVATFTSLPLQEACLLRGFPVLELNAWADQEGFDLCAALSVIPVASEAVQQLSTGVLRQRGEQALQPKTLRVQLQPLEAELQVGDRLRISLAGAAWPAIAINPGHTNSACGAPDPHCRVISIAIDVAGASLRFAPLLFPPLP